MKRIITLLLALSFVLTGVLFLVSCDDTDDTKLIMATNATFPPYEYKEGDEFQGIDIEIAQAIADKLGRELVVEDVDFDSIINGVQTGKYDIGMAGMTVTEDRLKNVNFTDTYAKGIQVVIVKEGGNVQSLDDIDNDGVKIGVQQGTTGHIYASDTPENGGYGEDAVIAYKSGTEAVEALKTGKVQCVIIDNEPAKSYVKENEGLKILDATWADEDYAIAISKNNSELLDEVNKALAELKADGTVDRIVKKYIPAE